MNIFVLSILSIGLYFFGTIHQGLIYLRKTHPKPFTSFLVGATAVICQFIVTLSHIIQGDELALSFSNSASLIACFIVTCLLVFSNKRPLQSIFLAVYPASALCTLILLVANDNTRTFSPENSGIFIHIFLSMIAYSIFAIAAVQAVLVQIQNNNLKKRNQTILMRNLPPLLTMENLLFEMIWSGTILLALAITAGLFFIDDLFAQHLVHKSFFAILALIIFTALLIGRLNYGWRGITASKWTLWGFSLLMLSFFGSKLILERISN